LRAVVTVSQSCRRTTGGVVRWRRLLDTGAMSRILLIEDDHAVRVGLATALERYGHDVVAAATGEDGLRRHAQDAAELVVLDLMLPGIDGFEVCRRIRAARSEEHTSELQSRENLVCR